MHFVGNFLLFPVVKWFWKSVEIWRSYRHEFSGTFLCGHGVYYITLLFLIGKKTDNNYHINCWQMSCAIRWLLLVVSGVAVWWTLTRWRQVWCVCSVKTVWSIPECFRGELLMMRHLSSYLNLHLVCLSRWFSPLGFYASSFIFICEHFIV